MACLRCELSAGAGKWRQSMEDMTWLKQFTLVFCGKEVSSIYDMDGKMVARNDAWNSAQSRRIGKVFITIVLSK